MHLLTSFSKSFSRNFILWISKRNLPCHQRSKVCNKKLLLTASPSHLVLMLSIIMLQSVKVCTKLCSSCISSWQETWLHSPKETLASESLSFLSSGCLMMRCLTFAALSFIRSVTSVCDSPHFDICSAIPHFFSNDLDNVLL